MYPRSTPEIVTLPTLFSEIAVPTTLCSPAVALLITMFSLPVVPIVKSLLFKVEIAIASVLLVKVLPEAMTAETAGASFVTLETLID